MAGRRPAADRPADPAPTRTPHPAPPPVAPDPQPVPLPALAPARRRRGRVRAIAGTLGLLLVVPVVLGMVALASLPSFDMRLLVVMSGSMEPTIDTGDAVVVRTADPATVAVGDVITYRGYGTDRLTTHRVIDVRDVDGDRHFRTQGDANGSPDPNLAPAGGVVGRVVLRLPRFGWVALQLQRPQVRLVALALPAALVAVGAVRDLRAALRTPAPARGTPTRRRPGSAATFAVAGALATLGVGVLGAATSLATYVDLDTMGENTFSTLAVSPPTGVAAEMDCGILTLGKGVVVSWGPVTGADGYDVLRSTSSGGPYTSILSGGPVTSTSVKDTSVANSTTYHYVVRTVAGTWSSADSAQVSITTPGWLSCSLL